MTIKYYRLPRISRTPSPPLEYLRKRQDMGGASLPPYPEGYNTDTKSSEEPPPENLKRRKARRSVVLNQKKNGWLVDPKDVKDYIVEDDDLLDSIVVRGATLVEGLGSNETAGKEEPQQKRRRIEIEANCSKSDDAVIREGESTSGITTGSSTPRKGPEAHSIKSIKEKHSQPGNLVSVGQLSVIPEIANESPNLAAEKTKRDNNASENFSKDSDQSGQSIIVSENRHDGNEAPAFLQAPLEDAASARVHEATGLASPVRRSSRQPVKSHKMRVGTSSPTRIEFLISRFDGLVPSIKLTGRDIFKNGRWYWEKLQSKIINSALYDPKKGEEIFLNCKVVLDIEQLHCWEGEFESSNSHEIVIVKKDNEGNYPPTFDGVLRARRSRESAKTSLSCSPAEKELVKRPLISVDESPTAVASVSGIAGLALHDSKERSASTARQELKDGEQVKRSNTVLKPLKSGESSAEAAVLDIPLFSPRNNVPIQPNAGRELPIPATIPILSPRPSMVAVSPPSTISPPFVARASALQARTSVAASAPASINLSPVSVAPIASAAVEPAILASVMPIPSISTLKGEKRTIKKIQSSSNIGENVVKRVKTDASALVLTLPAKPSGSLFPGKKLEQAPKRAVQPSVGISREIPKPLPYRRPEYPGPKNGNSPIVATTPLEILSCPNPKGTPPIGNPSERIRAPLTTALPETHSSSNSKQSPSVKKASNKSLLDAISMKVHMGLSQPGISVHSVVAHKEALREEPRNALEAADNAGSSSATKDTPHHTSSPVSSESSNITPASAEVQDKSSPLSVSKPTTKPKTWLAWDIPDDNGENSNDLDDPEEFTATASTPPPVTLDKAEVEVVAFPPSLIPPTINSASTGVTASSATTSRGLTKKTGFLQWPEPSEGLDGF